MVTVIYHNGTVDRFSAISQEQAQEMADELARRMGTSVKSIWTRGVPQ